MKKKRIFAWFALILFLLIIVNIMFLHYYVTESATLFLIYVLVFFFGPGRKWLQSSSTEDDKDGTDKNEGTENSDCDSRLADNEGETVIPEEESFETNESDVGEQH